MRLETKPRLTIVTNPDEIAAVKRENETGELHLPIGKVLPDGTCVAYTTSLERYRETLRRAALRSGALT